MDMHGARFFFVFFWYLGVCRRRTAEGPVGRSEGGLRTRSRRELFSDAALRFDLPLGVRRRRHVPKMALKIDPHLML